MARLNVQEAQEMASKGTGLNFKFFTLKDRESITIRFLVSSIEDVEAYSVHQITMADGKKRNVSCLRAPNEPVQNCPLCAISNKVRARIYLNVVDEKTHELLVWERSAQFLDTLEGYIKRFGDLRDQIFEVERKGTGLDTEYILYPLGQSVIEDKSVLPEPVKVLGTLLLEKTADDLTYFVNTGTFKEEVKPQLERREPAQNNAGYGQPQNVAYGQPQNNAGYGQGVAPQNPTGYQPPQNAGNAGGNQPVYTPNDVNPWGNENNNTTPRKRNGWN